MKKINITKFLKTYLLTLILIGAAFICSNNVTSVDHKGGRTEKKIVIIKTGTDFKPYYYLEEERS